MNRVQEGNFGHLCTLGHAVVEFHTPARTFPKVNVHSKKAFPKVNNWPMHVSPLPPNGSKGVDMLDAWNIKPFTWVRATFCQALVQLLARIS